MKLSFSSLHSAGQISKADAMQIFELAKHYKNNKTYKKNLDGKIVATLFFEPSTRTRLSFESAVLQLGGQIINAQGEGSTSIAKKESIEDTAKIVSKYCNLIIMRHSTIGSVERFAKNSSVPVINAGDGANEHPTQALLDAFTIYEKFNTLSGLNIVFVGDILHSRTIFSLVQLLSICGDNAFTFVADGAFQISPQRLALLQAINPHNTFESASKMKLSSCNVCYMTRVQTERLTTNAASSLVLTRQIASTMQQDAIIMHPLPRVEEIAPEVDTLPQAHYFTQAHNGLFVRMALLALII